MAQSPETARFDIMPRSVPSTTAVDAVLPPEALVARVLALALAQGRSGRPASGEQVGVTADPRGAAAAVRLPDAAGRR